MNKFITGFNIYVVNNSSPRLFYILYFHLFFFFLFWAKLINIMILLWYVTYFFSPVRGQLFNQISCSDFQMYQLFWKHFGSNWYFFFLIFVEIGQFTIVVPLFRFFLFVVIRSKVIVLTWNVLRILMLGLFRYGQNVQNILAIFELVRCNLSFIFWINWIKQDWLNNNAWKFDTRFIVRCTWWWKKKVKYIIIHFLSFKVKILIKK